MQCPYRCRTYNQNPMNWEEPYLMPVEFVEESIKNGFSHAACEAIHGGNCNIFCVSYLWRVSSNTYKIYGMAYLVQLIYKIKKMSKNPAKEGLKFLFDYIKSVSLTSVQMMLMRRILCILATYYRNAQNNLIPANMLSALYLIVQSPARQREIALYQVTNSMIALYKMAERRGMVKSFPMWRCLLFAASIAILCFHFFQNREAFRKNYLQSILGKLIDDS